MDKETRFAYPHNGKRNLYIRSTVSGTYTYESQKQYNPPVQVQTQMHSTMAWSKFEPNFDLQRNVYCFIQITNTR